jgi:hypothetical protein
MIAVEFELEVAARYPVEVEAGFAFMAPADDAGKVAQPDGTGFLPGFVDRLEDK